MQSCAVGGCPQRSIDGCPRCVHWRPSRGSKYYSCAKFLELGAVCPLPKASCLTCKDKLKAEFPGRPNLTGVDWASETERAEYMRDYMRKYRARESR